MKLKISKQVKSLVQLSSRRIRLNNSSPSESPTSIHAQLVEYMADISTQIKDYSAYENLGNYVISVAELDPEFEELDMFNVHQLRDFEINDEISSKVSSLYHQFLGDWKIISGNFSGHTITLEEMSAPSQMILSALVQTLGSVTAKTPAQAEVLVSLIKKNAHLKDVDIVTGTIFTFGKFTESETRAKLIITRFAIDLKDMTTIYSGNFECSVALENQLSLDELINVNRCQTRSRSVPTIDEMER